MKPRAIEVHVDDLVLEGVSPAHRLQVGAALEQELARLLRERGLPAALTGGVARDAIDAGSLARPAGTPGALGRSVARSVYAGLKR